MTDHVSQPVGAGNSAVVVDLARCGPMMGPRVRHHLPLVGWAGCSPRCAFGGGRHEVFDFVIV